MQIPIGKLINYSLALSVAVTVFLFILISLHELDYAMSFYRALVGGLVLLVTSMISIGLTKLFERKSGIANITRSSWRFILGCMTTALVIFSYQYLYMEIGKTDFFLRSDYQVPYRIDEWQSVVMILLSSIMAYTLVHILHNSVLLQHLRSQTELEVARLRSINAETTNQLLRQQIQPHFLFNALNVLKSLIKKDPLTAERYLLHLSDFLRTSFTKNKKGTATVREEIKLCRDYLEMQKMRFGDALEYRFEIPQSYDSGILPIFSLQPLAENAIKHNELTEDNPLFIRIVGEAGRIKVENNLQRKKTVEDSTGSGLSNLSERYKTLFGEPLLITEDNDTFIVTFNSIRHENRDY